MLFSRYGLGRGSLLAVIWGLLYCYGVCESASRKKNHIAWLVYRSERLYVFDRWQLGTFVVNGEWVCSPFVTKSGPNGAEHVGAESARPLHVILDSVVIIKCEIQFSYKRVITLLKLVYLTDNYITCVHVHCDRACARTQVPIPQIQFRMIITATFKELVQA